MPCRQHPWFMQHLPRYLAVMQADTMATSANIDQEMVDEVVRLGFTRSHIVSSLKSRVQNKVGVDRHVSAPHTPAALATEMPFNNHIISSLKEPPYAGTGNKVCWH